MVLTVLVALAAVPPAVDGAPRKPKRCKASQIAVSLKKGKRKACVKRSAITPDGTGTTADALVGAAFDGPLRRARTRRGKVGPDRALRRLGPRARKGLARVLPTAIDAFAVAAARGQVPDAGPKRRSAVGGATYRDLGNGVEFSVPEFGITGAVAYTATAAGDLVGGGSMLITGKTAQDIFGTDTVKIDGKVTLTKTGNGAFDYDIKSLELELEVDGITFAVRLSTKTRETGDKCPTSDGVVKESYLLEARLDYRISVVRKAVPLASGSVFITYDAKTTGQTADDAKLDSLDHDLTGTLELKASTPLGSIEQDATFQRKATVDMRSGKVTARGGSSLNVRGGGLVGLLNPRSAKELQALLKSYEKQTKSTVEGAVDRAVARFRSREEDWSVPETCLKLAWTPGSASRTVKQGDTGQIAGTVKAVRDGKSPKGIWTRTAQSKGTYTPEATTTAPDAKADVAWTTTGDSGRMSGTYRVTSKAGVAGVPWEADIELAQRFYRIISASLNEELYGQSATGMYRGTSDYTLSLLAQPFNPTIDTLYPNGPNGAKTGKILTRGTATSVNRFFAPGADGECELNSEAEHPDTPIGVTVDIGPNDPTATLEWYLNGPAVGVDEWPETCYPQPIGASPPFDILTQQVPAAIFDATTPQTVTFATSKQDLPAFAADGMGQIDMNKLEFSLTFQQVKPDGSAF